MCYKENYEPPKMSGNALLEVESTILAGSDTEVTTEGQEYVEVNDYLDGVWN